MESRTERIVVGSALCSRRQTKEMKQQERRPADPGAAPNAGYLINLHDGAACRTDAMRWPNSTEHTRNGA
jgi:hypothetical protein